MAPEAYARASAYLPLARGLARGRGDEAESDAVLALVLAARDYRQPSPVAFATFARFRISRAVASAARRRPMATMPRPDLVPDRTRPDLADLRDEAASALRRLPQPAADAARLVILQGLTHREAGARMGCGEAEVRRRLRLARILAGP